jgi:YcxB-like protein
MNYQFTIQFTEEHIKYACRKFFARYVGIGLPIVGVLMLAALLQRMHSGQMDLLSGFLLAVVVMGVGIFASAYFQRRNYAVSQLKKMGNGLVSYELSDEFFKAKSNLGSTELKWEAFKAVWVFPTVWLLMFDKAGYLTLPVEQIGSEVKEFLKQKIVSVGGKIK